MVETTNSVETNPQCHLILSNNCGVDLIIIFMLQRRKPAQRKSMISLVRIKLRIFFFKKCLYLFIYS